MRILKYITTVAVAVMALSASALTVAVEPGGLRGAVSDPSAVTDLSVSGSVNLTDFEFITLEMTSLRQLDLGEATVSGYEGEATALGRTVSPADVLPEGALMVATLESVTLPKGLKELGQAALASSAITSVKLPSTLTALGAKAFAHSANLKDITIPASVTVMGEGVFEGCVSLESAKVEASIKVLPPSTFRGCGALQTVSLPRSLAEVGEKAFAGCSSLTGVSLPASVEKIDARAFYGSGLRNLDLSGCTSLQSIGDWAFAAVPTLVSVNFPATMERMGTGAFFNNASMEFDAIPDGVSSLSDYSLRGVSAPAEVTLPNGLETIGKQAMANWKGVQVLTLPASLAGIGDEAMANWTALTTIIADKTQRVPALGADVWKGVDQPNVTLKVSKEQQEEYMATPQWKEFDVKAEQNPTDIAVVDDDDNCGQVTARFEGLTLRLEAPQDITAVQLYDLTGRSYSLPVSDSGTTAVSVDTSAYDSNVMIVRVILADGSAATLKLSR